MISDILHSHVGNFNIWSNTDNFAFPIVITLQWLPSTQLCLVGMVSVFFCVESFGTIKEDIYCVTSSFINYLPHKV